MEEHTVLVTGFEPFAGQATNASWNVVSAVDPSRCGVSVRLVRHRLPVVFGDALTRLQQLIRAHAPSLVLCVGQASGRAEISLERIAINVDDARIPDNAGAQPIDMPIAQRGPAAYWSTLPIKAIVAEMQARNLPAAVSQTAGTFVCNHVFYGLMRSLRRRQGVRGGFIHVPLLPEQAVGEWQAAPSVPLATQAAALEIAIQVSLTQHQDLRLAGGALD